MKHAGEKSRGEAEVDHVDKTSPPPDKTIPPPTPSKDEREMRTVARLRKSAAAE